MLYTYYLLQYDMMWRAATKVLRLRVHSGDEPRLALRPGPLIVGCIRFPEINVWEVNPDSGVELLNSQATV